MSNNKFKIVKISLKDFLCFDEFAMNNPGKVNVISGDNGLGKTTLIRAIQEAFKSSGRNPELIRTSKKLAKIMMALESYDGKTRVETTRTISGTTNRATVTVDGEPESAAQEFLNSLIGPSGLFFNPIDFFSKSPRDRRNMLLDATPINITAERLEEMIGISADLIDFSKYDFTDHALTLISTMRKDLAEIRKEQGRKVDQLKKSIRQDCSEIPDTFNVDEFADFDTDKKLAELKCAEEEIARHETKKRDLDYLKRQQSRIADSIEEKKTEIKKLEREIDELTGLHGKGEDKVAYIQKEIDNAKLPDPEPIRKQISAYNKSRALILKLEAIKEREKTLGKEEQRHEALDEAVKELMNDVPRQILSKAKLPIEGLTFDDDTVYLNKVAIENLSTREQMEFSVSLAKALSGPLHAICVDRIESMSPKNFARFVELCKGDDFQFFMTRVTDDEKLKIETTPEKEK